MSAAPPSAGPLDDVRWQAIPSGGSGCTDMQVMAGDLLARESSAELVVHI